MARMDRLHPFTPELGGQRACMVSTPPGGGENARLTQKGKMIRLTQKGSVVRLTQIGKMARLARKGKIARLAHRDAPL